MSSVDPVVGAIASTEERFGIGAARREEKSWLTVTRVLPIIDFFILIFSFIGGMLIRDREAWNIETELARYILAGASFATMFIICNDYRRLYTNQALLDMPRQMGGMTLSWVATCGLLAVTGFGLKASADVSRIVVFAVIILQLPILVASRVIARALAASHGHTASRRHRAALLSIGDTSGTAAALSEHHALIQQRYVDPELEGEQIANEIRAFLADLKGSGVQTIFVASPFHRLGDFYKVEALLSASPLPTFLLTEDWVARAFFRPVSIAGSKVGFALQAPPLTILDRAAKHGLDAVLAGCAVCLLAPLMFLIALAVKMNSRGPVIFRQRRLGFNGKPFNIFKFRSMKVLEDGDTIKQAQRVDVRVTRVGRFIRSTSLDELPQLFNVLRGEMSLVGPRPHAVAHDSYYEQLIRDYAFRRHMRPGLTGWAQVNGHRGETPQLDDMKARVDNDLWYINNWSLALDVWVMLRTVGELMKTKKAY